jgi:hypothetical protein
MAREYNLYHDEEREFPVNEADLESTLAYIRARFDDMRALLADAAENEPLPEDDFARTDDTSRCERCNFLKICRPELLGELLGRPPT